MKYYIITTTGFIRNKEKTLHCERYTHFTRSLNSFLYSFQRVFLVPRKRVRGSAGGQFLSEGKAIYPHLRQNFYPLLISLCPIFSCICVRSSLNSFLKSSFFVLIFYDHDVFRSDTKDVFFVQYLVGFGHKSRILSRFSFSFPDSTGVSQGL